MNDFGSLHDILDKLKNMMLDHGTDRVKLIALENIDNDHLRKCAEYVLRRTIYRIQLVSDIKKQNSRGKKEGRPKDGCQSGG